MTRFLAKTKSQPNGCLEWTGARREKEYGAFPFAGEVLAHRVSWLLHKGLIGDGLWVLHKCDNPPCVNPDHLFLGDKFDNIRDCVSKNRLPRAGVDSPVSILTDDEVIMLRVVRADMGGGTAWHSLVLGFAADKGMSSNAVQQAVVGRTWRKLCHTDDNPVTYISNRWTTEDEETLARLVEAGESYSDISEKLNRTYSAVKTKSLRLLRV